MKRTFFQTSSWGNDPESSSMKRRVNIWFYGRAVYVYGPPSAQLHNLPGQIRLSLDGKLLETIDLEAQYKKPARNSLDSRLLYHWKSRDGDMHHVLQISLLDSATGPWKWRPIRGFGLDSVVYTSDLRHPPKYELKDFERLEKVEIHSASSSMLFAPHYAWEKNLSDATAVLGAQTFRATSNELAYNFRRGFPPTVEFVNECTALTVYGASPAQLEAIFAKGFRHGHAQICLGLRCDLIDLHHAYLNVPSQSRNEPVLLYRNDRILPEVEKVVKMRLLDPPSPVGHQWIMSFSHAVCSQIAPELSWTQHMVSVVFRSVPFLVAGVLYLLRSHAQSLFLRAGRNPCPPLLDDEHSAPPSYVPYGTRDITQGPPPPPHDPITEPAFLPQRSRA
ncbi:hypothetical protein FRC01_001819 [Tulasnella sp. 417]|nr:hypothetical protein FRC01_001819 [Tulasnella sp. 417]